ncbi:hypothetical protein [Streptomyces sp. SP2-10]|uniref:hypothetical protein n=1 Tax=Streptomyces sp. SP2-10 TaxID=2873385 RepID=UPI0027E1F33D|nr:hypothetical protein [Streptomyces sp. SP2-10]
MDALAAAARDRGIEISRSQVRRILLAEGVRYRPGDNLPLPLLRRHTLTQARPPQFTRRI